MYYVNNVNNLSIIINYILFLLYLKKIASRTFIFRLIKRLRNKSPTIHFIFHNLALSYLYSIVQIVFH